MSKGPNFRLNYKGLGEVLRSPRAAALVNDAAAQLRDQAGEDAEMSEYTTDRRAASVSVPANLQASDGLLTKAAAAVGLTVRNR